MPDTNGTPFTKTTLINQSGYVMWAKDGRHNTPYSEWQFVARFKGGRGGGGVRSFMTHLCKHWTVEDYFEQRAEGVSPLPIVKRTGYLLPHIKRWLRDDGYPQTAAGYARWSADRRALRGA